jgi:hypothetical protein
MAKYAVTLQRTASSTASVGSITAGSTPRRIKIYDILLGSEASPADNAFLWQFQRCTAAGTSTAITPQPLDSADAAALSSAGQNHTVEPTYTANAFLLSVPLNQRSTFRWVAAPGGELLLPATNASGVGIKTPTMTAVSVTTLVHFEEQ